MGEICLLPKEYGKCPVTGPKEMEIQELPDKEFTIKILREIKENTDNSLMT